MSKPSPTGRLSESKPSMPHEYPKEALPRGGEAFTDFQWFSPGLWEKLERRALGGFGKDDLIVFSGSRNLGKSWFTARLYEERLKALAEERALGQLAIKKAIAAFLASFKR